MDCFLPLLKALVFLPKVITLRKLRDRSQHHPPNPGLGCAISYRLGRIKLQGSQQCRRPRHHRRTPARIAATVLPPPTLCHQQGKTVSSGCSAKTLKHSFELIPQNALSLGRPKLILLCLLFDFCPIFVMSAFAVVSD